MRTCFSGGNIFCVLLQVDDLFHKIDRRLRSSETEFREHNVLSAAYMLSAAFYNLAVPFFYCGIPHCLGRGNILISMLFFTVGAGTLIVFKFIRSFPLTLQSGNKNSRPLHGLLLCLFCLLIFGPLLFCR